MIMEIQVLPAPAGTADDTYAHVDAAIAAIREHGLPHEVGPLGTCVEGDADALWQLARDAHEAALAAGATRTVTVVKIAQDRAGGPTMDALTGPYRPGA